MDSSFTSYTNAPLTVSQFNYETKVGNRIEPLEKGKQYWWRVNTKLDGIWYPSAVWSFTTVSNCSSQVTCLGDVPTPARPDPTPNGVRDSYVTFLDAQVVARYAGAYKNGPPNANGLDYDLDKDGNGFPDGVDYDLDNNGYVTFLDAQRAAKNAGTSCTAQIASFQVGIDKLADNPSVLGAKV